MKILLGAEQYHEMQTTNYSCGAACSAIILRYYGYVGKEEKLIKSLNVDPKSGVDPKTIVDFFRRKKFKIKQKYEASLEDIESYIDKSWLIIVAYQDHAFRPSEIDYASSLDNGHYAVINGYDNDKIWFVDPSTSKPNKSIKKEEFLKRWRDIDVNFKIYHRWMIAIGPKKKAINS